MRKSYDEAVKTQKGENKKLKQQRRRGMVRNRRLSWAGKRQRVDDVICDVALEEKVRCRILLLQGDLTD